MRERKITLRPCRAEEPGRAFRSPFSFFVMAQLDPAMTKKEADTAYAIAPPTSGEGAK